MSNITSFSMYLNLKIVDRVENNDLNQKKPLNYESHGVY